MTQGKYKRITNIKCFCVKCSKQILSYGGFGLKDKDRLCQSCQDAPNLCFCGCGQYTRSGYSKYVWGHYFRNRSPSPEAERKRYESYKKTVNNPNYKFPKFDKDLIKRRSEKLKLKHKLGLIVPHKCSEKTKEKNRKRMLDGQGRWMRKRARMSKVSSPQKKLFENLLNYNSNLVLEHPIQKSPKGKYYLDIADVKSKINIEFDGKYWHKENYEKDKERDNYLKKLGWTVFRTESIEEKDIQEIVEAIK